jgi:hypothetical protein
VNFRLFDSYYLLLSDHVVKSGLAPFRSPSPFSWFCHPQPLPSILLSQFVLMNLSQWLWFFTKRIPRKFSITILQRIWVVDQVSLRRQMPAYVYSQEQDETNQIAVRLFNRQCSQTPPKSLTTVLAHVCHHHRMDLVVFFWTPLAPRMPPPPHGHSGAFFGATVSSR